MEMEKNWTEIQPLSQGLDLPSMTTDPGITEWKERSEQSHSWGNSISHFFSWDPNEGTLNSTVNGRRSSSCRRDQHSAGPDFYFTL
ncbi:unnamed protein product [Caretta caretta]